MESTQLLDILGNKNRRKIIQLLASRPYYISEISKRIGVGPKAVLEHLGLLEQSGLISSNIGKQRRKYYQITQNLKLEVYVSPYSYTMETSSVIQQTSPKLNQATTNKSSDGAQPIELLKQMNRYLFEMEFERRGLSTKQREIEGEMVEIMSRCINLIHDMAQDEIDAEIIAILLKQPQDKRSLSMNMRLPEYFIEEHIQSLINNRIIIERKKDDVKILSLI